MDKTYSCPICKDDINVTDEIRTVGHVRCPHCTATIAVATDADNNRDDTKLFAIEYPIVRVTLINPQRTNSYCEAGGKRRYYVNWTLPPIVTSAIGLGAGGRNFSNFEGEHAPMAVCEDRGDHLVAINIQDSV